MLVITNSAENFCCRQALTKDVERKIMDLGLNGGKHWKSLVSF